MNVKKEEKKTQGFQKNYEGNSFEISIAVTRRRRRNANLNNLLSNLLISHATFIFYFDFWRSNFLIQQKQLFLSSIISVISIIFISI